MEDSDFIEAGVLETGVEGEPNTEGSEAVQLPGGQPLSAEELNPIFAAERSNLCVLAGDVGSGKTALLTYIYHAVLTGKYLEKYLFAGSQTLPAFEERAYTTRGDSMRTQPDVGRTPKGSIDKFLHLRFQRRDSGKIINLLTTDFSGEDYKAIHADVNAVQESFPIARAANYFLCMLNGEHLKRKRDREGELLRMEHLLRTFSDGGLVKRNSLILIVISKYDLILEEEDSSFQEFTNGITTRVGKKFPAIEGRCKLYQIAAMPNNAAICPVGYGVDQLFDDIMAGPPVRSEAAQERSLGLKSQFNLWGELVKR